MWSYSLNFWEKNTSKEILKTSKPRNWTKISASLSLAWSEKTAKTLNLQVLEVCFQVLIDIWKNVNIPSDVAFERARKCLEAKNKQLKKEGKGNRPNAAEALSDDEINILYEKNLLGISNGEALINSLCLFNSLHFGLRGCGEHRQMCWGDVQLMKDADGTE